jgi:hypothetical protein
MSKRDYAARPLSRHAAASLPATAEPGLSPRAATIVPAKPAGGGLSDPAHRPHLGPDLQALIGQQLRAVYHEALNEPVPDRFVRLLEEMASKEVDRR